MSNSYSDKIWDDVKRLYVVDGMTPEQISHLPGMPKSRTIYKRAAEGNWQTERERLDEAEHNDLAILRRHRAKLIAKLDSIPETLIGSEDDPTTRITLDIQRVDNRIADSEHEVDNERAVRVGGLWIVRYLKDPAGGNDDDLAANIAECVEPAANYARSKQA